MKAHEIIETLNDRKDRSAWNKGVTAYAINILNNLDGNAELEGHQQIRALLLNGASGWHEYSWGGCAYIYDADIARALCTPSELRRTREGERRPNASEEWLDVQARACAQACRRIQKICAIHAAQKKAR